MKVAIGGASGLLGTRLGEALRDRGDQVVSLVRRPEEHANERQWDPDSGTISGPGLDDVDAVVNLAGAPIAGWRWSKKYKADLLRSRLSTTQTVVRALQASHHNALTDNESGEAEPGEYGGRCKVFLSASAVGYYGHDTGDELVTESSPAGDDFLADVCKRWEAAARPTESLGVRTVYLRTANVLDNRGGMMKMLRLPFKMGLGGRIGSGEQWVSWITSNDHVRAMLFLLDNEISGPVNLSAPESVRNKQFVKDYAKSINRPAVLPLPTLPLSWILTPEMVNETLLASQRVQPTALEQQGFKFDYPTYKEAVAWLEEQGTDRLVLGNSPASG